MTTLVLDRMTTDLRAAMKAKDAERVSALRLVKAAIDNVIIELRAKGGELDDAATISTLRTHVKRLKESMAEYRGAGRDDLADAAARELAVVEVYLPSQMQEDDVRTVVHAKREETGATTMATLMGAVMQELKGKADGAMIRRLVEEELKS